MELIDGLFQAVATDEPHGVKRAAVGIGAQSVNWHDAGMFKPAGDLGLEQEPLAAGGVVGMVVENLFECHLAVKFGVESDEHRPQAPPGVGP